MTCATRGRILLKKRWIHFPLKPVDLVAKRALHDRLRDAVLAEAQVLYAA